MQPNSVIKLLTNVPLEPAQNDTLWFGTRTEQTYYFNGKAIRTFNNQSYQRSNKGSCRVQATADDLYDVNYMMFQNTNYGSRWFYAFVDGVDYINDNTSEVRYTLDPLQTWLFDYQVDHCLVERETVGSDEIGEHIEPESLDTGEYIFNNFSAIDDDFAGKRVILGLDIAGEQRTRIIDGIVSPLELYAYDPFDTDDMDKLGRDLWILKQKPETVVSFYMVSSKLVSTKGGERVQKFGSPEYDYTLDGVNATMTLDGYKPKNNKMYTYPYNYLHVENNAGQSMELQYEFFNDTSLPSTDFGKPKLNISTCMLYPVEMNCMPKYYKGCGNNVYKGARLSVKGFPMCAWNIDGYQAWVSQNSVPIGLNVAKSVAQTAIGIGTSVANPLVGYGLMASGLQQASAQLSAGATVANSTIGLATNLLSQRYQASIQPDISNGSYESGGCDYANNRMQFYAGRKSVNRVFARRIDDYFTMFGYARGVVKIPNNHLRERFTYVKTVGCTVSGSLPSSDAKYISDCYDRGIRFWVDHTHMMDYSLPNLPL